MPYVIAVFLLVTLCVNSASAQTISSGVPAGDAVAASSGPDSPKTVVDEKGRCVATALTEGEGRYNCLKRLLPYRPSLVLQTPGSFFVGYAWGKKSNQVVYGPQVGLGATLLFPVRRPFLEYDGFDDADAKVTRVFSLPSSMSFTFDLAVSLNANLAGFKFPDAGEGSAGEVADVQQVFNVGVYLGPQLGAVWWENGQRKRVAFALGVLAGYIDTEATGAAFVSGIQPALVAEF